MWARALILAAVCAVAPALVQAEDCQIEGSFLIDALGRNGYTIEQDGDTSEAFGRCRIRGMVLSDDALTLDVELLEWQLDGLAALQSGNGRARLDAEIQNLRLIPKVDDPWIGYMLKEQNRRNTIDANLSASWDPNTGVLDLERLGVAMPGNNGAWLSFRAIGVGPAMLDNPASGVGSVALESMDLGIANSGFADGLILGALVGALSDLPGAPESQIDATRRDAKAMIEGLPSDLIDAPSKAALGVLLDEAPVPWGRLEMSLRSDPALPLLRLPALALSSNPLDPAALGFAFEGARIKVTFVPDATPE